MIPVTASPADLEAYLRRLGCEPEPPSAEALTRLHHAHAERIAYETVWVHLGEGWPIDPATSVRRLGSTRRGGYCYHLNGAFSELLASLGYDVTRHVGGVVGGPGDDEVQAMTNHLVLQVAGLPTDAHPDGTWYVDVGLGDAMHGPLPLVEGTYEEGPFTLSLARTEGGIGDWRLAHDPGGSFAGNAWRSAPASMEEFEERHGWLSTDPESHFVRFLVAQRRSGDHVDVLKGLLLRRVGAGASEQVLDTRAALVAALTDVFGLDLSAVAPDAIDSMWQRAEHAHARWESSQAP